MKEHNKTPEKELNEMEITNLSDAEFKTLVIRMLKEIIGYCNNIKKIQAEMKVALSEIKKNIQGTNSGGMKPRIKSTIWNIRKKESIQSEEQEGKIIKTNKDRIRSLWDNFKRTNIRIIGVLEREKK